MVVPIPQVHVHVDIAHHIGKAQLVNRLAQHPLGRLPQGKIGRVPTDAKPLPPVRGMERSHGRAHLETRPTTKMWSAIMPTRSAAGWSPNTPRLGFAPGLAAPPDAGKGSPTDCAPIVSPNAGREPRPVESGDAHAGR